MHPYPGLGARGVLLSPGALPCHQSPVAWAGSLPSPPACSLPTSHLVSCFALCSHPRQRPLRLRSFFSSHQAEVGHTPALAAAEEKPFGQVLPPLQPQFPLSPRGNRPDPGASMICFYGNGDKSRPEGSRCCKQVWSRGCQPHRGLGSSTPAWWEEGPHHPHPVPKQVPGIGSLWERGIRVGEGQGSSPGVWWCITLMCPWGWGGGEGPHWGLGAAPGESPSSWAIISDGSKGRCRELRQPLALMRQAAAGHQGGQASDVSAPCGSGECRGGGQSQPAPSFKRWGLRGWGLKPCTPSQLPWGRVSPCPSP